MHKNADRVKCTASQNRSLISPFCVFSMAGVNVSLRNCFCFSVSAFPGVEDSLRYLKPCLCRKVLTCVGFLSMPVNSFIRLIASAILRTGFFLKSSPNCLFYCFLSVQQHKRQRLLRVRQNRVFR
jgi:hypothetical protein